MVRSFMASRTGPFSGVYKVWKTGVIAANDELYAAAIFRVVTMPDASFEGLRWEILLSICVLVEFERLVAVYGIAVALGFVRACLAWVEIPRFGRL